MLTDAQLGAAFRYYRAEQNISQEVLAKRVGCGRNTVHRLEIGAGTSLRTLFEVAEELGHPFSRIVWHAERKARG